MEMFSMRVRNKSKHKFVATKVGETAEVKKYLSPKIENEDFGWCVNEVICSLDYGNVSCSFSENIVIRNGSIVWKVVWIEYYLRLNLSSRRY